MKKGTFHAYKDFKEKSSVILAEKEFRVYGE